MKHKHIKNKKSVAICIKWVLKLSKTPNYIHESVLKLVPVCNLTNDVTLINNAAEVVHIFSRYYGLHVSREY